jgi:hypothetical protein
MITGFRHPVLRVALGVLAVTAVACQRVALLAPNGSTITLTTLATTLPLNGTTHLIAQVIEPAGTPPQRGTLVTFTTSLGTIEPIEAETDPGGRVMVTFKAGTQSGTATVTALSGGVTTGTTGAIKIAIGAAGTATIGLTASPAAISPGGKSTITATISDATGAVIGGVPVTFTTDNGSMNASVVTTDAHGNASGELTTTKTAKVTATAGVASTNGTTTTAAPSASVTVTVEPVPTASITASGNAQVGVPVSFTITAQPGAGGSTTILNVTIDFGDGEVQSLGAATGTTTVQHVYQTSGSKTARVTVTDSNGGNTSAATIVFVQTQNPIVSLTIDSSSTVGGTKTVNFRATVTPAGTSVSQYVWNFGDGQSQTTFTNTVAHDYATATLPRTATVTITTTTNQTASSSTTVSP